MKRNGKMLRAGVPSANQPSKFRGFRKNWRAGEPVIVLHPVRAARRKNREEEYRSAISRIRGRLNVFFGAKA